MAIASVDPPIIYGSVDALNEVKGLDKTFLLVPNHGDSEQQQLLPNCTFNLKSLVSEIQEQHRKKKSNKDEKDQRAALAYIVVVLLFYSMSIIILLVKYIRKQKRQWQEDKLYSDFLANARLAAMKESKFMWSQRVSLKLKETEAARAIKSLDLFKETSV